MLLLNIKTPAIFFSSFSPSLPKGLDSSGISKENGIMSVPPPPPNPPPNPLIPSPPFSITTALSGVNTTGNSIFISLLSIRNPTEKLYTVKFCSFIIIPFSLISSRVRGRASTFVTIRSITEITALSGFAFKRKTPSFSRRISVRV